MDPPPAKRIALSRTDPGLQDSRPDTTWKDGPDLAPCLESAMGETSNTSQGEFIIPQVCPTK